MLYTNIIKEKKRGIQNKQRRIGIMKLQIALDEVTIEQGLKLCEEQGIEVI